MIFQLNIWLGKDENMNRLHQISILMVLLLLLTNITKADDALDNSFPRDGARKMDGHQCIILKRSSPNFEKELLSVPPNRCVITIGEWIVKFDFRLMPIEVVTPKKDVWLVDWRNLNLPISINEDWIFKVKVRGTKSVIASLNYKF